MNGSLIKLLLLCGTLSGCTSFVTCTDDLQQRLTPTATTLTVGQEVQATAEFLGCGGSKRLADEITWSSADPAVANVDAATGRITGLSAGTTRVTPRGSKYGVLQHVVVTVR